uniref:Heterogeneous nuclear ribonucleoprotein A1 n=1 Tax=Aegilops tauschii TaxID=37682 RepID=M8BD72_AEGTA
MTSSLTLFLFFSWGFQDRRAASQGDYDEQDRRVKGAEVFVGGLPRSATEGTLREIFSTCGEIVDLRIMKDQNGVSKLQGKRLAVDLSLDQDTLFFGNLCKEWSAEEFEELIHKKEHWDIQLVIQFFDLQTFKDVISVDLATASNLDSSTSKRRLNRGFAFVRFSSHGVSLVISNMKFINLWSFCFEIPDPGGNRARDKQVYSVFGQRRATRAVSIRCDMFVEQAAARVLRIGSRTDFMLGGILHPAINWAERESNVDADEMAKIKTAFVGNLPANANEEYLKKLFGHFGEVIRVAVSRKGQYPVGFIHFGSRSELDNAIKEMDGKTVSVARPAVENDNKRSREEVKTRRSNVSGGKPDYSHGRYGHDSVERQTKAPRLSNRVADVTDPYEAALNSLPSAVNELLLRILRLGIGSAYDSIIVLYFSSQIDIHCIKSLSELPESGAVAVLNQFLITGSDKRNKGEYFLSLIAKRKVEAFGAAQILQDTTYLSRNSEIQTKRYRHQDYDYTASGSSRYSSLGGYPSSSYVDDPIVSQSRRYGEERPAVVRYPEPRLRREEVLLEPRPNIGRQLDRIYTQEQSYNERSAHEPRQDTGRHLDRRDIHEHSYKERQDTGRHLDRRNIHEQSYIERSAHEPRQNTGRHIERRYTQEQSYIERPAEVVLPRERRLVSAAGYATNIEPEFKSRSSAEYSAEHQQMRFDPYTGEPYKFDPFTGEPIRPEPSLRRSGSLY